MPEWNGMKVLGETFSPSEQERAWNDWEPSSGCTGLEYLVEAHRGIQLRNEIKMRAADRMLQRARKMGFAKYENGRWHKLVARDVERKVH